MQLPRVIVLAALVVGGCASILPSPASGGRPATLESLPAEWSADRGGTVHGLDAAGDVVAEVAA